MRDNYVYDYREQSGLSTAIFIQGNKNRLLDRRKKELREQYPSFLDTVENKSRLIVVTILIALSSVMMFSGTSTAKNRNDAIHFTPFSKVEAMWKERTLGLGELIVKVNTTGDALDLQELEKYIDETLRLFDEVVVNPCYNGWYSVARSRFDLFAQGIAYSRNLNTNPQYAQAAQGFFYTANSLDDLLYRYQTEMKCPVDNKQK